MVTEAIVRILFIFALLEASLLSGGSSATTSCDLDSQKNFFAARAVLESMIQANDTLLWELSGIFSNKYIPLKQLIAHYKFIIPKNQESCDERLDCNLAYESNDFNCPDNYSCIALDYIWGRYPITAHDNVFRSLDVCPLVIGEYEQREVDIYFVLESPPSCNLNSIDEIAIKKGTFPCGWRCESIRTELPKSGEPDQPISKHVTKETPLERALTMLTAKLLAYGTIKEAVEGLKYDSQDAVGYSVKLPSSSYFNVPFEYSIFFLSYISMHIVILMLVYRYRVEMYKGILIYVGKNKIQFCLFWSFIITFFILFCNISIIFAAEGGICFTLLQLYLLCISLFPGLLYVPMITCFIKREHGFFRVFCNKCHFFDHFIQILIFTFFFTFPHVVALIIYFSSVSFFYDPSSTSFLLLYFSSSSVVLWIVNAIVLYLVLPLPFVCYNSATFRKIFFAIFLAISVNLLNVSVMPFIGDYFYDRRLEGTSIFAVIPIAVTFIGWYQSRNWVKLFAKLLDDTEENESKMDGLHDIWKELKQLVTDDGKKKDMLSEYV